MKIKTEIPSLPLPITVDVSPHDQPGCAGQGGLEGLLGLEWLLTNRLGAYSSSTALGCNTRRYHGLLVAAATPPVGRRATLSTVMEQLRAGGETYDLATNQFDGAFAPQGYVHLRQFRNDVAAAFVFRPGGLELTKEIILAESANAVAVRYTLRGGEAELRLRPFVAMRDYHHLQSSKSAARITFETAPGGVVVHDRSDAGAAVHLLCREAAFQADPQWWYKFYYRVEVSRGQDGFEDLYTPGVFVIPLRDGQNCQLTASLGEPVPVGFATTVEQKRRRLAEIASAVAEDEDETASRLAAASDAFVVSRSFPGGGRSTTILAGYHWFADWGRDAFVALPGLLLSTGRLSAAEEVFKTFAASIRRGLVPNRFDDYSTAAHYNSIDASLWFIVTAERYLVAGGDPAFWRNTLMPAAKAILKAFREGTDFDIRADADMLLSGGSPQTQLTWMDVKLGRQVVTPRHGKAVEVNALWHCAHRILAERCRGIDDKLAGWHAHDAELIADAFRKAFWNESRGCLYDCITGGVPDGSIRPNQVLAVSLPHSPLTSEQQAAVLRVVEEKLLTPMGLRTLSPDDSRYRGRYGGSWESRDKAYHQGTVWAWLMGPFVEAYLKVHGDKPFAVERCRSILGAFDGHLRQAGLGFISEIFDGDPPHTPRGCIAQAWSVGEVLRARRLVSAAARRAKKG